MKKSIFILMLCGLLGACANHVPSPQAGNSLLSFDDIAAEITVTYESLEAPQSDTALAARSTPSNGPGSP